MIVEHRAGTAPRVAVCQPHLDVDRPADGWGRAMELASRAADDGADLVVLPELATTGYAFRDRDEARQAARAARERLSDLVALTAAIRVTVVTGTIEDTGARLYNSAVVVTGGQLIGRYRKAHLWDAEARIFDRGDAPPLVVQTPVGRVGLMVCYDLEFPEFARMARQLECDLLTVPVNWPLLQRPTEQQPIEITKAQATAANYRVPIAIADRQGAERGVDWTAGSCLIDRDGFLVRTRRVDLPAGTWWSARLPVAGSTRFNTFNDVLLDRRPELYQDQSHDLPGEVPPCSMP